MARRSNKYRKESELSRNTDVTYGMDGCRLCSGTEGSADGERIEESVPRTPPPPPLLLLLPLPSRAMPLSCGLLPRGLLPGMPMGALPLAPGASRGDRWLDWPAIRVPVLPGLCRVMPILE